METLFTLIVAGVISVFIWRGIRAQQERDEEQRAQDQE